MEGSVTPGDYLPPAKLVSLIERLWPDASQPAESDLASLLQRGQKPHQGIWCSAIEVDGLPRSLSRIFDDTTISKLNYESGLIAAAVTVMLIATAPEEFGLPECTTTLEAAGLEGLHRWGIILPNSSRVSMLTYKAVVAVRYPELVVHAAGPILIGHFVPHDLTVDYGGFRTVMWDAPKDLRTAVEDIVAFLAFLQRRFKMRNHGATAQLLVMCNRTAVHHQLVQHGFRTTWEGGLRITTSSSAAGATARIAVVVQTGCGFLSGSRRDADEEEREDC